MKTFLVFCLVVIMAGCEKPFLAPPDPVKQLKDAAQLFNEGSHGKAHDFAFDVRKTDSLISPLIGTVQYVEPVATRSFDGTETSITDLTFVANFAYQENRWVFKGAMWEREPRAPYPANDKETLDLTYERWGNALRPR